MSDEMTPEQQAFNEGLIKLGEETQGIRHTEWWTEPAPNLSQEPCETFRERIARRLDVWTKAEERALKVEQNHTRKPSIFSRLFSSIGTKRHGWSPRRPD